jgi:hypothetical protein
MSNARQQGASTKVLFTYLVLTKTPRSAIGKEHSFVQCFILCKRWQNKKSGAAHLNYHTAKIVFHTLDGKKSIVGLVSFEIGGLNAMVPLIVGAELGLPLLDCDGLGRAFPELQMFCPLIYDSNPYPATLADDKGRRAVVLHADTAKGMENNFRRVVVEMGCTGFFILPPLTKDEALNKTVIQERQS